MSKKQPEIRRSVLLAIRETARTQLDDPTRAAVGARLTGESLEIWEAMRPLTADWYEESISVRIIEALHAVASQPAFVAFIEKLCDNGFGRLRRMFLSLATPIMLASRAPDFWAYDHATGKMTTEEVEGGVLVSITEHPYAESKACRSLMTEYVRHAFSLTRVKRVTASEDPERGKFGIVVQWSL